jgi:hypothetical protein
MSQAEELRNGLEEPIEVRTVNPDTEPHIVINPDKTITIPDALKRILVQYDHNIETVTFDCPRYWDGRDLSEMNMRIVFQRSDGHREPHPVENLRVDNSDDSMIHFDWTISKNTTLTSGNILITVCAKIADAEGIPEREWHTIPNRDLFVNEGMDCSGDEIVEQNPDIIEFILARLDECGSSDEQIAQAVSAYLDANPVQAGATPEQAAQIQKNAEDIAKLQKQSSTELFDKADLPLGTQSFVTVDGVEYYRYHAGATYGFTWNNPHPQKGAVTITARGVSQYGGTGGTRLKTVYNDGTSGPDLYIVVGGESRTVTVTTDENKTLAKITGNYDLENWVLMDMSVMSVKANYAVSGSPVIIDTTLTQSGQAADAAANAGLCVQIMGNTSISVNIVTIAQSIDPGIQVPPGTTIQLQFADTAARD